MTPTRSSCSSSVPLTRIYCVAKRRWTKRGLLVGLVNLPVVALVSVAPIRGWADPEYAGFSVGLLQASQGPMVTLVAGSLFLAALVAACIVVLNRVGRAMWLPTVVDGFLALNFAIILIGGLVTDPEGVRINLGEYVSVPPFATALLLFFLPLAGSSLWAYRRTGPDST